MSAYKPLRARTIASALVATLAYTVALGALGSLGCEASSNAEPPPAGAQNPPPPRGATDAAPRSVAGCWDATIELPWPAGDTPGELCLEQSGEHWAGKFFLRSQWRPLAHLHVKPDRLDFEVETPMGTAKFDLRQEGDALAGTADGAFGTRPLRAKRK